MELEEAVVQAQVAFDQVPEFAGLFIIKHHFSLHSAHDIREGGPPRHRTALMFENKLQWVKRAAKRTNFKNPIFAVVDQWSVCTARELARLQSASRHEIEVVYVRNVSDECVTSASLLAQHEEGLYEHVSSMLRLLFQGGDDQLWAFAHCASVSLHHVHVMPDSFILHWSEAHPTQCLALVTNIVQVRKEENASSDLWLDIYHFPSVLAPSAKQLSVIPQDWQTHVANPNVRVRVLERFDQLRFTGMRRCSVPGAHVFIVA